MLVRNCPIEALYAALEMVNLVFEGNITWNRAPERVGSGIRFTLRVKDSKKPGHRRSHSGRRHPSACWHVHGLFFSCLFHELVAPDAVVISRWVENGRITRESGNWQDADIGSIMFPLQLSRACDCKHPLRDLRDVCPKCNGLGHCHDYPLGDEHICPICKGIGFVTHIVATEWRSQMEAYRISKGVSA